MIIRVTKNSANPYVMMNKHFLQDVNLSWKAKGLLAYLLSLPDDWQIYESELIKHAQDGKDSLNKGLQELIKGGYIQRKRTRNEKGQLKEYEYLVYEVPTYTGFSKVGFSYVGESATTNNDLTDNDNTDTYGSSKIQNRQYVKLKLDDIEEDFLRFYLLTHKRYLKRDHVRVTKENLSYINEIIDKLKDHGVDNEIWETAVTEHFSSLPKSNNGNILAFFKATERYFQIDPYREL